jgi:hypothetical protein
MKIKLIIASLIFGFSMNNLEIIASDCAIEIQTSESQASLERGNISVTSKKKTIAAKTTDINAKVEQTNQNLKSIPFKIRLYTLVQFAICQAMPTIIDALATQAFSLKIDCYSFDALLDVNKSLTDSLYY